MNRADPRAQLLALSERHGESLARLSRIIGRNPAYLQQYVRRGTPKFLPEAERQALASYFRVDEAELGGPVGRTETLVSIPRIDAEASAGPGRVSEDRNLRPLEMPRDLLRTLGITGAALSMITARGDSMWPLICDGDQMLVDHDSRRIGHRPLEIFVLRLDGAIAVKRLARETGGVRVVSENPAYPPNVVPAEEVEIIGRVVWLSRAI